MRAVALPLSALAFVYWLAARPEAAPRGGLTAVGVGATLLVLLALGHPARAPERRALLHRRSRRHHRADRRQPQLGGHVHARAQPHVQGRHRPERARRAAPRNRSRRLRDRARVVPLRAGLRAGPRRRSRPIACSTPSTACSTGRSCGPACWSAVRRPGSPRATTRIARFADAFGLAIAGLALAGVAAAARAPALAAAGAVPFQLAFVATYATFFAEPRYRLADRDPGVSVRRARARRDRRRSARAALARRARASFTRRRRSRPALVLVVVWRLAWPALLDGGTGAAGAPPLGGDRGRAWTDGGACCCGRRRRRSRRSRRWRDRPRACTCGPAPTRRPTALRVRLGGGPLPAGKYALHFRLEAAPAPRTCRSRERRPRPSRRKPATFDAEIDHSGGPLALVRRN